MTNTLQREVSIASNDIEALPVLRDSDPKENVSSSSSKKDLADQPDISEAKEESNTLVQAVRPPIKYDSVGVFFGSVLRFVRSANPLRRTEWKARRFKSLWTRRFVLSILVGLYAIRSRRTINLFP